MSDRADGGTTTAAQTVYYTRTQIVEILEIESDFLAALEQESVISVDAPEEGPGEFSAQMFERIRVAHNLVHDLDVNLAGVSIIVRMREAFVAERTDLARVLLELQRRDQGR